MPTTEKLSDHKDSSRNWLHWKRLSWPPLKKANQKTGGQPQLRWATGNSSRWSPKKTAVPPSSAATFVCRSFQTFRNVELSTTLFRSPVATIPNNNEQTLVKQPFLFGPFRLLLACSRLLLLNAKSWLIHSLHECGFFLIHSVAEVAGKRSGVGEIDFIGFF